MPLTLPRFAWFTIIVGLFTSTVSAQTVEQVVGPKDGVKEPFSIAFDKNDVTHFVEMKGGDKFCKIDAKGKVVTLAEGIFNGMHDLVIAPDGMIYLADTFNHRILSYNPITEKIAPFAGTGKAGYFGDDVSALKAEFNQPICLALSNDGRTLKVADIGNNRVRAINIPTGRINTIAGNGKREKPKEFSGAKHAKQQPLFDPRAVTVDKEGNTYILERAGNRLLKINTKGMIQTVAGTGKKGI